MSWLQHTSCGREHMFCMCPTPFIWAAPLPHHNHHLSIPGCWSQTQTNIRQICEDVWPKTPGSITRTTHKQISSFHRWESEFVATIYLQADCESHILANTRFSVHIRNGIHMADTMYMHEWRWSTKFHLYFRCIEQLRSVDWFAYAWKRCGVQNAHN